MDTLFTHVQPLARIIMELWILFVAFPLMSLIIIERSPDFPHVSKWVMAPFFFLHGLFTLFITAEALITMQWGAVTSFSWMALVTGIMGYYLPYHES